MITLSVVGTSHGVSATVLGRVTLDALPPADRGNAVFVLRQSLAEGQTLDGYAAVLSGSDGDPIPAGVPAVVGCRTDHLGSGDVVSIDRRGHVRTLYRRASRSNSLFATERCNSYCLMCSQPPRNADDSGRAAELVSLVRLIDPATEELGITGGEPTLLGDGLLAVIAECRDRLPRTALHVLSNGRLFADRSYARALGAVGHPNLMVGVPLYSDIDAAHDYVVQAKGAFDETLRGLLNLAEARVPLEIRVVIHRDTFERLPHLGEFIYRNLTFASHVAFMGLEVIGFAKANIHSLWVDPADYSDRLERAVLELAASRMNVSVYNHQLCTIPNSLWPFARQSISDWKNEFAGECRQCSQQPTCCGFFAWNVGRWQSRAIAPIVR